MRETTRKAAWLPDARANGSLVVLAMLLLGALFVALDAPAQGAPPGSRILVDVGTFRSQSGALGCRLYSSPSGFPEASSGTVEKRVAIGGKVARCTFENVAPGTYAVSVMHDENGNAKLDKSFFGVPTEGYGVSNNHTHALSSPSWEESKFVVERGKDVGLGIGLRY